MNVQSHTQISELTSRVHARANVQASSFEACVRRRVRAEVNEYPYLGGITPTRRPPPSQAKPDSGAVRTCFPPLFRTAEAT